VELMVAALHVYARVRWAAGTAAATIAGRVFCCAVGWRRERLEAYRAVCLWRSAHLDKELVQLRAERFGLGGPHPCVDHATKVGQ